MRSGVMSSTIQMPRPCVATTSRRFAGLNGDIADGNVWKFVALVLRPLLAAIGRNPQAKFGSEKQQVRRFGVFFDDVRKAAHAAVFGDDRGPRLAVIRGLVSVRVHIAKGVAVEGDVSGGGIEAAGFHPRYPGGFRQVRHIGDNVSPRFAAIARDLHVAIVGADPNGFGHRAEIR